MIKKQAVVILLVGFLIIYSACGPTSAALKATGTIKDLQASQLTSQISTGSDSQDELRQILTRDQLLDGYDAASPIDDGAFTVPEYAQPARYEFEGRLELLGEADNGQITVLGGEVSDNPEVGHLPEFDFEFIQHDGYLAPLKRGLIITDHPLWNYIIEPGRVWQEPGDGDYSRASFPFALSPKGSNALFNGVMTFLFNDEGISKVWYQITQETSVSWRIDFWGILNAVYHAEAVGGADQARTDFSKELSNRFPVKPIDEMIKDYPGSNPERFGAGVTPQNMTYYGFVIDGVNYVSDCQTRYGQYAYCDFMRVPSYSTAKSAFVSVALMRLAQKYDPGVGHFLIKDYAPEYIDSPGDWSQVTFDNTLDMATGNYRSSGYMTDEDNYSDAFWDAEGTAAKLAAAFDWPHSAPPGTQWVYRTIDTFIVTNALDNYLKSVEGSQADIFEFVVDEVYKPILIGPGFHSTLRSQDDNWQGQPMGGYGLWWIQDDIAKVVTLLQNGGLSPGGEQILHPDYLAAAMQQNPNDRGVMIDSYSMYNNAFWATKYGAASGFDCEVWAPHMLGYSGIVIVLMPNGTTYYYASDNREFTWALAIKEANKLAPLCD